MQRSRGTPTNDTLTEDPLDEELQARRAVSDMSAFVPLYRRYYPEMVAICLRWLGDSDDAQDATSEIFHKVMSKLSTFHGGSFRKWIYTIAVNTLRDRIKTSRPVSSIPIDAVDPGIGPEKAALDEIDATALRAAMARLPLEDALVIEMRSQGYRSKEVAAALGRSDDWVRTTHSRSIKTLARELADVGERSPRHG